MKTFNEKGPEKWFGYFWFLNHSLKWLLMVQPEDGFAQLVNFFYWVVNEALFVKEKMDVGWVFPKKLNSQDDSVLFDRQNKCKIEPLKKL